MNGRYHGFIMSRTTTHLRLVASQPAPRTWGEGFTSGHDEGYEQGRRDRGLELLIAGFVAGALALAALLVVLR